MIQLVAAAAILWVGMTGLRWASRADPKAVAKAVRRATGAALSAMALALLVVRGNFETSLPLAALGAWLLGWPGPIAWSKPFDWSRPFDWSKTFGRSGAGDRTRPAGAGPTHFAREAGAGVRFYRSDMIELRCDDATGDVEGWVHKGQFEGKSLRLLGEAECAALSAECRRSDPEGLRILEFYMDRRFSRRSSAGQNDADARGRDGFRSGEMSEQDAYQILGLHPGASREEVTRAHRALMKKVHPDHGGTASLAALLNEAKDILTRRHR